MDAVAIDVTTNVSGIAEGNDLKYGFAVKRGSLDRGEQSPGFIQVCGSSDQMLGIADDDPGPKSTANYYNKKDLVRVLQSGCKCKGWLYSGNSVTRGDYLQLAGSGMLKSETSGTRTATSVAQAEESKSSSASAQQLEIILM